MKIIFFGSSNFAVPSLTRILESSYRVCAVVTQPDRKKGRHLKLTPTPVKSLAISKGLKVHDPEKVSDPSTIEFLRSMEADLFIVVSFGQILPADIIEIPSFYSINLHPSLLPKYRGAAPVNWAIINGETKTGLSIIRMNESMDAGDIILQRKVDIYDEDNAQTLNERLSELGSILLTDAIRFIEIDRVKFKKQDERKATLAPRLKKEDGLINWKDSASNIRNRVRGTIPWPGAYTYFYDKKINIWSAGVIDGEGEPGAILESEEELIVGTGKGILKIEEIQMEGKKRMSAPAFLRGYREMKKGAKFDV